MARDGKRRGKPRAKGVELPSWFLDEVREIADQRKKDLNESLGELGQRLAEAVHRDKDWDHSAVSRFLTEEVLTAPMAIAFAELFGIPRPFFTPQSHKEAQGMQQVFRRHNAHPLNEEQRQRLVAVDQGTDVIEEEARDQTAGVASVDEVRSGRGAGTGRGRRTGRTARGRS